MKCKQITLERAKDSQIKHTQKIPIKESVIQFKTNKFSGSALFSGGQFDSNASGGHSGTSEAGTLLRADLQRDLALHPQRLRGLRILPVSILPHLQPGDLRRAQLVLASLLDFNVEHFTQVERHSEFSAALDRSDVMNELLLVFYRCSFFKLAQINFEKKCLFFFHFCSLS